MRISRRAVTVSGVAVAAILVAGAAWLFFRPGPGPLSSVSDNGQPVVNGASGPVRIGQEEVGTAFIHNSSHDQATLVSASLVAVPGMRVGKLAHVAINKTHDIMGAGKGWPPKGIPIKPLPGARVGYGQTDITYGITGTGQGFWVAAGLKITYHWHGNTYTVTAWSVVAACIHDHHCLHEVTTAENRTRKLAGRTDP